MQNNNKYLQEDDPTDETLKSTVIKNNLSNRNFLLKCNMKSTGDITTYTFDIKELAYQQAYHTSTIIKVDTSKKDIKFPLEEFIILPSEMRNLGLGTFILYEVLRLIKKEYKGFNIQKIQLNNSKDLLDVDKLKRFLSKFNISYEEKAEKITLDISDIYNTKLSYNSDKLTILTPDEYISALTNLANNAKPISKLNSADTVLQNMSQSKLIKLALIFSVVVTVLTVFALVFL